MKKRHYLLSILAIIIIGLLAASCTVQRTPDDTVPRTSPGTGQTRFVPVSYTHLDVYKRQR